MDHCTNDFLTQEKILNRKMDSYRSSKDTSDILITNCKTKSLLCMSHYPTVARLSHKPDLIVYSALQHSSICNGLKNDNWKNYFTLVGFFLVTN